jgi:four helix bundle protein
MEKKFNDFRDMSVWQKAFSLLKEVYVIIKTFPSNELYALTDDLKRAANSVCHNIAEGYGRFEPRDKSRLYKISRGSSYEAISQLLVAESQLYISSLKCENMIIQYKEVIEELNALIFKLDNQK